MKANAKTSIRYAEDLRFHLLNAARSAKAIEDRAVGVRASDKARRLKEASAALRQHATELREELRATH